MISQSNCKILFIVLHCFGNNGAFARSPLAAVETLSAEEIQEIDRIETEMRNLYCPEGDCLVAERDPPPYVASLFRSHCCPINFLPFDLCRRKSATETMSLKPNERKDREVTTAVTPKSEDFVGGPRDGFSQLLLWARDARGLYCGETRNGLLTQSSLFEGDILGLPKDVAQGKDQKRLFQSAIRDEKKHWPDGIVPYEINNGIRANPAYMQAIMDAIEVFHNETCVRFRRKTKSDEDFIFFMIGFGCNSYPGRQLGWQAIRLEAPGCFTPGLISHEMMHALGFYHEQARSDRDNFVDINFDNVIKGEEGQFENYLRAAVTSYGEPYDFGSIMHYGQKDFAADNSSWTIRPKSQYYDANVNKMGQRKRLSEIDVKKINIMYQCPSSGPCPSSPGWLQSGGWCYYFSFLADELEIPFYDARIRCKSLKARLAVPYQQQQALKDFILPTIKANSDKIAKTDLIWVDGFRTISGADQNLADPKLTQPAQFICQKRAASATA